MSFNNGRDAPAAAAATIDRPASQNTCRRTASTTLALVGLVFSVATPSFAQSGANTVTIADPALEARVKALSSELRCLVCQNQTVADSDAPVARDMREQVRAQVAAGKSDAEVKRYMTDRFGDFVLYKPPLKATTVVLWVAPFALLALAVFVLARRLRRRNDSTVTVTLDVEARARAKAMLDE